MERDSLTVPDINDAQLGDSFVTSFDGKDVVTPSGLPNVGPINLNHLVKKPRYFDSESSLPRECFEEYQDAIFDNYWSEPIRPARNEISRNLRERVQSGQP